MHPGNSPLERLPEDLQNQVMQYLTDEDRAELAGASRTLLHQVSEYVQRQLEVLQQELEATAARANTLVNDLNTYLNR